MDQRRAAGALLALLVCITTSAAAPTVSNQTGLDLYDSSTEGCYYNFQHYGEGDRIMTNEPCLNCTCHNRMLMCYLRVCPFTKPIGQDCTVEKREDQCCPIVTCPDVPVDLLTSTTTSPAEYGATGVGKLDKYGCSINGKYLPEGSKVPPTPNKPCEHCYCIRNMTTCVMQECTLHVDGCTPIYHKDVCCPVRYSCDHPEDETLLLDDMTTTVRPTPGFLLTTTTLSPVTQMSQDCVHDDQIFPDGALIKTEKACEHCYCMKGDIVCVVQECGTPMENEGKNCTSQPPREGQCCPDTYICEGDEITTEPPSEYTTQPQILEDLTTRRVGAEGSGYRNEPDEPVYTEIPSIDTEPEGSGYEPSTEPAIEVITPGKEMSEVTSEKEDEMLHYGTTTLRTPTLEEIEKTTEPDKGLNTVPSDEEGYKPKITEKTTVSDEEKATDAPLTTDDKPELDKEKSTVQEEQSTPSITQKVDESFTTTEPVFRKEDSETTETDTLIEEKTTLQPDEQEKRTTLGQDFVTVSGTKAPFMEELEKQTTVSAESTEKDAESSEPKEPTTESILEPSTSADAKPTSVEITADTAQPIKTEATTLAVEKIDVTETSNPDENEIEDILTTLPPGRIPGEGDCLLNEITYRNNSEVPSYNACDTGCMCISSIVKCERIICSPPPDYMDNCQPTYDPPGSCCPTYSCRTIEPTPPQSYDHRTETEKPIDLPATECHGDECEISKDKESSAGDLGEKPGTGDCKSEDCKPQIQPLIPDQPTEKCDDGNCQAVPVEEPIIVPVKDVPLCSNEEDCKRIKPDVPLCQGDGCSDSHVHSDCSGPECDVAPIKPHNVPEKPSCDNEEDCNKISPEVPACEGEKCSDSGVRKDCSGAECSTDAGKLPIVPEQPHCDNEEDCKRISPEVPTCEGEGCSDSDGHMDCSGPECSTNAVEPPSVPVKPVCEGEQCTNVDVACSGPECTTKVEPQQPLCDNEEDCKGVKPEISCEGPDCKIDDSMDSMSKPDDQPCNGKSCRRKEPGDIVPEECAGTDCDQQQQVDDNADNLSTDSPAVVDKHDEMTTSAPLESHPTVSEDIDKIHKDLDDMSTRATESPNDKVDDTTSDLETTQEHIKPTETSILDIIGSSPGIEDKYTKIPEEPVTDGTIIGVTDIPREGMTETAEIEVHTEPRKDDVTEKTVVDEEDQKTSLYETDFEPTEGPHVTDTQEIRTSIPQESSTEEQKEEETVTKLPEQYVTNEEDVKLPIATTEPGLEEISTIRAQEPEEVTESHVSKPGSDSSVTKIAEEPESPELQEQSTKLPESLEDEAMVTISNAVTETAPQETEGTYSNDIVDKTTHTIEEELKKTTESILDAAQTSETEKQEVGDEADITTLAPKYHEPGKDDVITESPEQQSTESNNLSTKEPTLQKEEITPETTDNEKTQTVTPVKVSDTTSPLEYDGDHKDETVTKTPETTPKETAEQEAPMHPDTDYTPDDVGMTQAPISVDESTETSESSDKPMVDENDKTDQPSESPTINEVTPMEKTEAPVSKPTDTVESITDSPDYSITRKPEQPTEAGEPETGEDVTGEPEISTEEPSITDDHEEHPGTEKVPSEPYIPVHTESSSEQTPVQVSETTEKLEIATELPEPSLDTKDDVTEVPDKNIMDEESHTDTTKHSDEDVSKPITESSVSNTESIPEKPSHEDDIPKLTEMETTEHPEKEMITKEEIEPFTSEILTTQQPAHSDIPSEPESTEEISTLAPRVKDEPAEAPHDNEIEQTTEIHEGHVTGGDTSSGTEIPESHVKEQEPQDIGGPEKETTVSEGFTPTAQEEMSPEPFTEKLPDTYTKKDEEKSTMPPLETPDKPEDEVTEKPENIPTEEPSASPTSVPETPKESSTETHDMTPSVILPEKPTEEQQKPVTDKQDDTTGDYQETSTNIPREETSISQEMQPETPEKYTVTSEQTTTPSGIESEKETQEGITEKAHDDHEEIPAKVDGDSTTISHFVPSDEETTQSPQTIPDLVELEEHSHKPMDEISTTSSEKQMTTIEPAEPYNEKDPETFTEKQENDARTTVPPAEEEDQDVTSTDKPIERLGEDTSPEKQQPENVLTTEKPLQETTVFEELIPITAKYPESFDHTKQEDKFTDDIDVNTEQPAAAPEKEPTETAEDEPKPTEPPKDKLDTESTEGPMIEPSREPSEVPTPEAKPTEEPSEKPLDEPTEVTEGKPAEEPEKSSEKPIEVFTEKSAEEPAEEPTEEPTKELSEESTDKPEQIPSEEPIQTPTEMPSDRPEDKPLQEPVEPSVGEPTEKPGDEAFEEPTGMPSEKPLEEQTDKPEETPLDKPSEEPEHEPSEEPTTKTSEEPTEKPEDVPAEATTEKPDKELAEKDEKPLEEPTETPAVEPVEKPEEEPLIEPSGIPSEEATDKPSDEATDIPTDRPSEQPSEEPIKTPIEEPTEKPIDEATETSTNIPLEEPIEKPAEEPLRTPEIKPSKEPVEEPFEKVTETPSEEPVEKPDDRPSEEPIEKPEDTPSEVPEEKPEDKPSEVPEEKPEDKPSEEPEDKPSGEPVEKTEDRPSEEPVEKPEDKPSEEPVEKPEDKPSEEPVEKPEDKPSEEPVEKPADKPSEEPVEKPEEKPSEEPVEKPEDKPVEEPVEKPEHTPSEEPEVKPEDKPSEEPVEKPKDTPSEEATELPFGEPTETPKDKPSDEPVEKPSEEGTESPSFKPSEEPIKETQPEKKPSEEPSEEKPEGEQTGKPFDKPVEIPEEYPVSEPSLSSEYPAEQTTSAPMDEQKPEKTPLEETEEKPVDKIDEKPLEEPVEKVTEKPEAVTEETPLEKPEEKPHDIPVETTLSTAAPESPKPGFSDVPPTDEMPDFPPSAEPSGYGTEPDYVEEDQPFGPGTCRYGGKVYVSAQQIPRDDPCDFCFCFRSDIICLQQSCPPPIHGCHEEPIQGFCCPRYECPVAMATTLNVTTTTTTTTTTLPPHFLPHAYKGAAQRRGCQIKGHTYKVGEVVRASSGPCLHCTCGGDGQMKCDPKACTPEPMLRQMIAAAVSAKRRR